MVKLNAHFDGKVIVPDEPLNLPANQKLRISVETVDTQSDADPTPPTPRTDFSAWIGLGLPLPTDHTPRFTNNDQLWEKGK